MVEEKNELLLKLSTDIISAYVSNHSVDADQLMELFDNIYLKLSTIDKKDATETKALEPAVPIEDSIQDQALICLEDGKKFKLLKRHLSTTYKMSPAEYRTKWGLAPDYPMVAPSYSEKRRQLAKTSGLGKSNS